MYFITAIKKKRKRLSSGGRRTRFQFIVIYIYRLLSLDFLKHLLVDKYIIYVYIKFVYSVYTNSN